MKLRRAIAAAAAVLGFVVIGCSSSDTSSSGPQCGNVTCGSGQVCCNDCAGGQACQTGGCPKLNCPNADGGKDSGGIDSGPDDSGTDTGLCGTMTCKVGEMCCPPSGVIMNFQCAKTCS